MTDPVMHRMADAALFAPDAPPPDLSNIRVDDLILVRAETPDQIEAAQRLRFDVFYAERGAHPIGDMADLRRDYDQFDPVCDHLLVMDQSLPEGRQVVGTYRLLLEPRAAMSGLGLYSETRCDLSRLRGTGLPIMELSRSCVADAYRSRVTINLLWAGIARYVFHYSIAYMVGIASFPGNDVAEHAQAFAYMHRHFLAEESIRPVVRPEFFIPYPDLPLDRTAERAAMRALPPLVRGYLRMGARVGEGLQIDRQFNTIIACLLMDTRQAAARYARHYSRGEEVRA